ncbi:carbohydrate ABC transporter permease [Pelagibacterium montanilacus]|uniref:carbohydrate ABC transporter permease n=1 Tax=Pelagibacterium montanilacus TaxID=2185280 RepID=UPI000F8ECF3F|nr:sugar ABC transporter permease [Pelagibacterium montanilacus]
MTSAKTASRRSPVTRVLFDGPAFPFIMIVPALLVLGFVIGLPMLEALRLSFDTIALRRPAAAGTYGLHNYARLVSDPKAYAALGLSALYMTGTVLGSVALALSAALLTRRVVRFSGLARIAFLLPWTMPAVVTALVWGVMYDGNFGVINRLLDFVPFVDGRNWLVDRSSALGALIVAQVWNEFPVAYIFFLAGLKAIPEELYEAAKIDRANAFQQFRHITLPHLRFIIAVIVILLMIMGFKSFPIIFLLTGGGPAGATETMTVLTYNTAFRSLDFSYAATLGILAVLASAMLVLGYLRLLPRTGHGDVM